jgi:hypothetical protein
MKTLTNKGSFKYLFLFVAAGVAGLSSCKTDDSSNPTPIVKLASYVSITNAVEGSLAQDLYLDNAKVNLSAQAVAYGQTSSYLTSTEGTHTGNFTNTNTTTATAAVSVTFTGGQYYSVYYTGTTGSATSVTTVDDLTAPAAGKAKVRFIQLSQALNTGVDFGINATTKLVTNLAYKAVSAYNSVDANTTFFLYATGSTTATLSLPVTIEAGKIYTIYVSGNTTATLKYNVVVQK